MRFTALSLALLALSTAVATSAASAAGVGDQSVKVSSSSPKPLHITGRVLRAAELPGFAPKDRSAVIVSVADWNTVAPSNGIDVSRRLRRAGFVAAIREDLLWARGSDRGALSAVVRLGSPRAATSEVRQEVRDALETHSGDGRKYTPFAVSGIPAAHGFTLADTDHSGHNIVFADGPFTYWVGVGWGAQAHDPPTRAQLIAAATSLYTRVHGRPAP